MRNRGVTGEQWATCDQCGRDYPMSMLTVQKGLRVCERDVDDLTVERHAQAVGDVLQASGGTEGTDLRFVDSALADLGEVVA